MKIDLNNIPTEIWDCNDPRLPITSDLKRTPPDRQFLDSLIDPGQLQPILMCHNDTDGWFIAFGRRRLLGIRMLLEEGTHDGRILVSYIEATKNNANLFSLVENAQRAANGVADYMAVKEILHSDRTATYESIAKSICKSKAYVQKIDRQYCKIPSWALEATLAGDMAETTAVLIGSFSKTEQEQCYNMFKKDGHLSHERAQQIRRFIQQEIVASFAPGLGFTEPQKQEFYPRSAIEEIASLLEAKKYPELRKLISKLLSQ